MSPAAIEDEARKALVKSDINLGFEGRYIQLVKSNNVNVLTLVIVTNNDNPQYNVTLVK